MEKVKGVKTDEWCAVAHHLLSTIKDSNEQIDCEIVHRI